MRPFSLGQAPLRPAHDFSHRNLHRHRAAEQEAAVYGETMRLLTTFNPTPPEPTTKFRSRPASVLALAAMTFGLGACPIADEAPPEDTDRTPVTFNVPRGGFPDFLETPFPSDLLKRERNGETLLDLRAFPNPGESAALDDYLNLIQATKGWSTTGAMYFHVADGIDVRSLPQSALDSVAQDASMFLVEVDNPSERIPIVWEYTEEATSFLPAGTLSVLPVLGVRLRGPAALVVTSAVQALNGVRLGPSEDLAALINCTELADADAVSVDAACDPYAALAQAIDLDTVDIASMQLFTPQAPVADLVAAAERLQTELDPAVSDIALVDDTTYSEFDVYRGTVMLQQFQAGDPPYNAFDGVTGSLSIDASGALVVQREDEVEFIVTVPKREPPTAAGWPIVVYGHGTGGDNLSAVGEGPRNEAHQLARAGWAVLSVAEPLHDGRRGYVAGSEELYTFNLLNPVAGRDNWRQSALEKLQMVTVAQSLDIPAAVASGGTLIDLDGSRIAYMGHSQGAIVGAVFLGLDHRIEGAFLSGVGGGFAPSLVDKVEPVNILEVFRTILQLPAEEPVGYFHPVLTLLQTFIDPADPLNFGDAYRSSLAARTPHVVATSGLTDRYTPRINHDGFAGAFRLPQIAPISDPIAVLDLLGVESQPAGSVGNDVGADGAPLTTGILQYADEGHFAVYYDAGAQEAYRRFFQTLREEAAPVAQVE